MTGIAKTLRDDRARHHRKGEADRIAKDWRGAVQAVSKWKFRPGRKNGHAVFTHMQVPIVFTLNEDN